MDKILIRGARTHNLKNIDLTLPRDKLIVITMEQIMPYQWDSEFGLKEIIYNAITK